MEYNNFVVLPNKKNPRILAFNETTVIQKCRKTFKVTNNQFMELARDFRS